MSFIAVTNLSVPTIMGRTLSVATVSNAVEPVKATSYSFVVQVDDLQDKKGR